MKAGPNASEKDSPLHVQVSTRRWRFITRQYEMSYPNWRQVIPQERDFATKLTIDPETLDTLIHTIQRLPDHDPSYHALGFHVSEGQVHLLCKANAEADWKPVPVQGVTAEGKKVAVYLNREYVLKALRYGLNRLEIIHSSTHQPR
jgi:DNA polymerase III sliding clamp (beta) subunit (PCNA family)